MVTPSTINKKGTGCFLIEEFNALGRQELEKGACPLFLEIPHVWLYILCDLR
jgi:hypothetical protein